jgi:hypothetical protein
MNTTRPIGQSQTMQTLQTMKRRGWRAAAVLCSALALSACASSIWTPDALLGQAVRQAQQVQTIDPYAALREPEESGTDGAVAKAAIDRYQKSYETLPPPVNVLNIGVGTGVGTTGVAR